MATKAQQRHFTHTSNEHQRAVVNNLQRVAQRHGVSRVFSDFVEMAAIALARLDRAQFEIREARYLQIVDSYQKHELELLVQAFAHLTMAYELNFETGDFGDLLGSIYMMLDLGNAGTGQFFTPYHVSLLMAQINMTDVKALVEQHGFVCVQEPAVGAGGMVIATAQAMAQEGVNYQNSMHVTAIDVDMRCVHMAFVQFSLLHIPAVVIHGNSLAGETYSFWYTPAHLMGGWEGRLAMRKARGEQAPIPRSNPTILGDNSAPEIKPVVLLDNDHQPSQLVLF